MGSTVNDLKVSLDKISIYHLLVLLGEFARDLDLALLLKIKRILYRTAQWQIFCFHLKYINSIENIQEFNLKLKNYL